MRGVRLLGDALHLHRLVHRYRPQQRHLLRRVRRTPEVDVTGGAGGFVEDVGHGVVDEGLDGGLSWRTMPKDIRLSMTKNSMPQPNSLAHLTVMSFEFCAVGGCELKTC